MTLTKFGWPAAAVLPAAAVALVLALALPGAGAAAQGQPTCSDLGISNHGEHVVGDYVTGTGGLFADDMTWPPAGQVGQTVAASGGPAVPGGPAAGGHFNVPGLAPGASFCLEQAHPGGFDTPAPFAP
jgi:hypothetical protein